MNFSKPAFHSGHQARGFSLMEMLITLTILGVITALAVPTLSSFTGRAKEATHLRNAQNVAAISASATAAGIAHVLPESYGGVKATVRMLREGIVASSGPLVGEMFIISGLTDEEIDSIVPFLDVVYDAAGLRLEYTNPGI